MIDAETESVPLGTHVPTDVYRQLKDTAAEEYGDVNGSVGKAVSTAIKEYIDDDRYAGVEDQLDDLLERGDLDVPDHAEKKRDVSFDGETTQVGARVHPDLKERAKQKADEWDSSLSELVAHAFHAYVTGGRPHRLQDKLDRLEAAIDADDEDDRTTTEQIIDQLPERQFTLDKFLEAAEAAGVGTESYALEEYLPDVLDETDRVVHPRNSDIFTPTDVFSGPRDPSQLPYEAMDEDDMRLAIKAGALRRAAEDGGGGHFKFQLTDAREVLGANVTGSTVRPLLRDIAEEGRDRYSELKYEESEDALVVNPDRVEKYYQRDGAHEHALTVAGLIDAEETAASPDNPGGSTAEDTDPPDDDAPSTTAEADTTSPARADGGQPPDAVDDDRADDDDLRDEAAEVDR